MVTNVKCCIHHILNMQKGVAAIIGGVVGGIAGFFAGGPVGAAAGTAIGAAAGAIIASDRNVRRNLLYITI